MVTQIQMFDTKHVMFITKLGNVFSPAGHSYMQPTANLRVNIWPITATTNYKTSQSELQQKRAIGVKRGKFVDWFGFYLLLAAKVARVLSFNQSNCKEHSSSKTKANMNYVQHIAGNRSNN